MLVLYDEEDVFPSANPKPFLDRKIVMVHYERNVTFDGSKMQKTVRDIDGEPEKVGKDGKKKPWIYRHYIPQCRIIKAIEECIIERDLTRKQVLQWLIPPNERDTPDRKWKPLPTENKQPTDFVTVVLQLEPDDFLKATGSPLNSRLAYDAWIDWAVGAICDWPQNIFYGPGKTDGAGTKLDIPTGKKMGAKQFKRVQDYAPMLQAALMKRLSLSQAIPREKYKMSVSADLQKRNPEMCNKWKEMIGGKNLPWEDPNDENFDPEEEEDDDDMMSDD